MAKKIIVIGAGIAGLSAGCYGQKNGFDTEIYEMHNIPGGLCTSWSRNGYTLDGCIHWLMGVRPSKSFYKYWNEIGALEDMKFKSHDLQLQVESTTGQKLTLYSDVEKLEKELLAFSPEDKEPILEFTNAVRKFMKIHMSMDKPQDMYGFLDYIKMMGKMGSKMMDFAKLNKISVGDFMSRFKNKFLAKALPGFMPLDYTLLILVMTFATYANQDAGWPMGGSLEFAKSIEKSYLKLGGKINYKTKVKKIIVKDNKAVGIQLLDGSIRNADYVISAADGHATIYDMLDGKYVDENIKKLYSTAALAPTSVQVSLGVDCDLSSEPHVLNIELEKPFTVGGIENKFFSFRHYCYDATIAPRGKSSVTSILYSDYNYWENLRNDKAAYDAEKKLIADEYVKTFEKRFPYAKGKIEVVDVATPYTYTRYTGTWKGVYMSWLTTTENPMLKVPGKLPGLGNCYMAGQWANASGGVPVGVITGRWAILRICKEERKKFEV